MYNLRSSKTLSTLPPDITIVWPRCIAVTLYSHHGYISDSAFLDCDLTHNLEFVKRK